MCYLDKQVIDQVFQRFQKCTLLFVFNIFRFPSFFKIVEKYQLKEISFPPHHRNIYCFDFVYFSKMGYLSMYVMLCQCYIFPIARYIPMFLAFLFLFSRIIFFRFAYDGIPSQRLLKFISFFSLLFCLDATQRS